MINRFRRLHIYVTNELVCIISYNLYFLFWLISSLKNYIGHSTVISGKVSYSDCDDSNVVCATVSGGLLVQLVEIKA